MRNSQNRLHTSDDVEEYLDDPKLFKRVLAPVIEVPTARNSAIEKQETLLEGEVELLMSQLVADPIATKLRTAVSTSQIVTKTNSQPDEK